MRKLPAIGLVIALVATACGGGSGDPTVAPSTTRAEGQTGTTAPPPEDDIIEDGDGLVGTSAALADLREANDDALPLQAALDLFAAVFGDLPGAGAARFEPRQGDGSLAIRAVGAHWEELTAEQHGSVLALLGYPPIESFRQPLAFGADPALQARVDAARAAIAGHVGGDVPFPIVAEADPDLEDEGVATPERDGVYVTSGTIDACRVTLLADATDSTVAHEVFHCFQYHLAPSIRHVLTGPDWIVEGSAEWAGARVGGVDADVGASFDEWGSNNRHSLFSLDYSAIGFFWVIESMGVDPWRAIVPMLAERGEAAVAATGLDPGEVLRRIATSIARRSVSPTLDVTDQWDFAAPDVPGRGWRTAVTTVTPDRPFSSSAARSVFTRTTPSRFRITDGDIVTVSVTSDVGALQFEGEELHAWSGSLRREFCLEDGGCRCGSDDEVESGFTPGSESLVIGAAERDGGTITFSIEVRDPGDGFTDGHWVGTITATPSGISFEDVEAEADAFTAPFEVIIEDGAVVGGSYTMIVYGEARAEDMFMTGVGTITGGFEGCGSSPQMVDTGSEWLMTAHTPDGDVTIPLSLPPGDIRFATIWLFDAVTNPNHRSGRFDNSASIDFMQAVGVNPTGNIVTFEATRTG